MNWLQDKDNEEASIKSAGKATSRSSQLESEGSDEEKRAESKVAEMNASFRQLCNDQNAGNCTKPQLTAISKNHRFDTSNNAQEIKKTVAPGTGTFLHADTLPGSGSTVTQHNTTNLKQGGDLDMEVDSFLRIFSSQHDYITREVSMRQWMHQAMAASFVDSNNRPEEVLRYVQSALPIALKLTEAVIGADACFHDMIPLASIASENVYIKTKDMESDDCDEVSFRCTSCSAENHRAAGSTMSRLHAVGIVLHELFTRTEACFDNDVPSANSLGVEDDHYAGRNHRPTKRTMRSDDYMDGLPYSICALLKNLLDCGRGELCGDKAFSSLSELRSDLQRMLDDPEIFLYNIETNPLPQLLIPNKLYGRDNEIRLVEDAYKQNKEGTCSGVVITGGAGVGKSRLAMHVQGLNSKSNGYFIRAKFDQTKDVRPLSTLGAALNELCDLFVRGATPSQLKSTEEELKSALGSQMSLLAHVLPSVVKLVPSCVPACTVRSMDSVANMQYLFRALLTSISSNHSRHVSFLLDDLQWADAVSLLLIKSLITSSKGSQVFFACCYRDQDAGVIDSGSFTLWLSSISVLPLVTIKLKNMTSEGVNKLVAEALHLSPRLTRPLSSVLFRKTRGDPLFLRQMMLSLQKQRCIYVNLSCGPRWDWDLQKIEKLKLSDTVLSLLSNEMQKLAPSLQLGLKVASAVGSRVKNDVVDVLSNDLRMDLRGILRQVSQKGFMKEDGEGFCFVHDKIQQAASELDTEEQRRTNSMRFGLALCAHAMNANGAQHNDLFFTAVNMINKGGPAALSDPSQRLMVATLNLEAGRRSINLSDYNSGLKLFDQGIRFLPADHWKESYELSLNLFDGAAEAACVTNKSDLVQWYAKEVSENATVSEDKVISLWAKTKALSNASIDDNAISTILDVLKQLGETQLRPMGDARLITDLQSMNHLLQQTTDDAMKKIAQTKEKKILTLMKIYISLVHLLHFRNPALVCDASLRMMELTLKHGGFCSLSPIAFAYYGQQVMVLGNLDLAIRLGYLALHFVDNNGPAPYKSEIIAIVYQTIFWINTPFQSIAEKHWHGHEAGVQAGAIVPSVVNLTFHIFGSYIAGQSLTVARKKCKKFALGALRENVKENVGFNVDYRFLLHVQLSVLVEGMHLLDAEEIDGIPGKGTVITRARESNDSNILLVNYIHHLARTVFFRLDVTSLEVKLADLITARKIPVRPLMVFALFFEGLVCFRLARQTEGEDVLKWIKRGKSILAKFELWSEYCKWNFQSKMLLLQAESASVLGEDEEAETLYTRSIKSAHDHKFIHEEAIASELAGLVLWRRGLKRKSYSFFAHAAKCFNTWGALAVAERVEKDIQHRFGLDARELLSLEDPIASILSSKSDSLKRGLDMP